jgi:hypothetical protein
VLTSIVIESKAENKGNYGPP